MTYINVSGYCPMGCGQTLRVYESSGTVFCMESTCPDSAAVTTILSHDETEHVAQIGNHDFTLQHPLKERREGNLFGCELNDYLHSLPGSPVEPGRYRVIADPEALNGWRYEEMA